MRRLALIVVLAALPFSVFVGVGAYTLQAQGTCTNCQAPRLQNANPSSGLVTVQGV